MGFFKAYDMRGTFGRDFDLNLVYGVGRHLPAVVRAAHAADLPPGRRFRALVGRDARVSSPAVSQALTAGLRAAGAEVTDLGPATTPMVYFFTAEEDFDCSVMVTASHNPPEDNGLKVSRRGALPMGYDSGLAALERLVTAHPLVYAPVPEEAPRAETDPARLARYVAFLREATKDLFDPETTALRFAVDCSDGMASLLAPKLFGRRAVYLNAVPDGTFPHHAPNPLKAEAREQLAETVRREGLDAGVVFDGDADRCLFVDEKGSFIQPDFLIPFLAETFRERPGTAVIHDVRTSRAAIARLREGGFTPVMGRVGHAFAKVLLRETKAVCGGELAGHYYFRDFHFCDSGMLAALRLLGSFAAAKARGERVSALLRPVRERYANAGELNFRVADKAAAIARVLSVAATFGPIVSRNETDGVRLEFPSGWISIRASNTEPYLRLIVEWTTPETLAAHVSALSAALRE